MLRCRLHSLPSFRRHLPGWEPVEDWGEGGLASPLYTSAAPRCTLSPPAHCLQFTLGRGSSQTVFNSLMTPHLKINLALECDEKQGVCCFSGSQLKKGYQRRQPSWPGGAPVKCSEALWLEGLRGCCWKNSMSNVHTGAKSKLAKTFKMLKWSWH